MSKFMFTIITQIMCVRGCNFLQICMNHILAVLRIPAERASGFTALGEMAGALDGELVLYLPMITSHLRDAVCHPDCLLTLVFTVILVFFLVTFLCSLRFVGFSDINLIMKCDIRLLSNFFFVDCST